MKKLIKLSILLIAIVLIISVKVDLFAQSGGSQGQTCVITEISGSAITATCPGGIIQTNSIYSTSGYYRVGDSINQDRLIAPQQQQRNKKR